MTAPKTPTESVELVKVHVAGWDDERRRKALEARGNLITRTWSARTTLTTRVQGLISCAESALYRHRNLQAVEHLREAEKQAAELAKEVADAVDMLENFGGEYTWEPPLVKLGQGEYARYVWGGDK